jgi:hypothetical protein
MVSVTDPYCRIVGFLDRQTFIPWFYKFKYFLMFNLGCLHPVARVRSDDVGFYPSTQRHYRIYYLYITQLHVSVVRPPSGRKCITI